MIRLQNSRGEVED